MKLFLYNYSYLWSPSLVELLLSSNYTETIHLALLLKKIKRLIDCLSMCKPYWEESLEFRQFQKTKEKYENAPYLLFANI